MNERNEFKVTKDYMDRFQISIGVGKKFRALNLNAVAYALQHYFHADLFDNAWNYEKHIEHNKECNCCPLCEKQNPKDELKNIERTRIKEMV